jgi:small subunit ribosomal protein S20
MAHSNQARKRIRQNETNRLRNKARMSTMKTHMKAVFAAVRAGEKDKASELVGSACKAIDKAAKANIIHSHRAARHKGQVMRAVAAMQ